jgi:hypothetical protein
MMVRAIDQRDVDRGVGEGTGDIQPAEPAAYDDHSMTSVGHVLHLQRQRNSSAPIPS